jgi:putative redox protein
MATHETETQWMGKMQFNSLINGHTIIMDAPERGGGEDSGAIPKPFILTALSGCAGMELVAFLKKLNLTVDGINVKAKGELTSKVPYYYTSIHLIFEIRTNKELENTINDAVQQVMTSICGVSYMLQKIMPLTWEIKFY